MTAESPDTARAGSSDASLSSGQHVPRAVEQPVVKDLGMSGDRPGAEQHPESSKSLTNQGPPAGAEQDEQHPPEEREFTTEDALRALAEESAEITAAMRRRRGGA